MLSKARKERKNFVGQVASGLTFFAIGGILPPAAQAPLLGAVAAIEGETLIQDVMGKDLDIDIFSSSLIETGAICMLVGGSAAVAAPYLFIGGLLAKTLIASKKLYESEENRTYHAIDAATNFLQAATIGLGWAGGIGKKVNLGIAGTASLLGGVKSLLFSTKKDAQESRAAIASSEERIAPPLVIHRPAV